MIKSHRIAGILALCMIVSAFCGCSSRQPKGGVCVVLQAVSHTNNKWPASPAARAKIMEAAQQNALNKVISIAGGDSSVDIEGDNKLVITFPKTQDPDKVIHMLTTDTDLELYWLKDVQSANNPTGRWAMELGQTDDGSRKAVFTDNAKGTKLDSLKDQKAILEQVVGVKNNKPILTGKDLLSNARADYDGQDGAVIRVEFNPKGTQIFKAFTARHQGEYVAVFFDGKLLTAPEIREAIPNGNAQISGFRGIEEAKRAADVLNAGTAPVELKLVSKQIIKGN